MVLAAFGRAPSVCDHSVALRQANNVSAAGPLCGIVSPLTRNCSTAFWHRVHSGDIPKPLADLEEGCEIMANSAAEATVTIRIFLVSMQDWYVQ
jgi:hypothetical protein